MTHVLNGSLGTQFLYNIGARVVKVEPLGHDNDTRTPGPYVDGQPLYYSFINHGKESVVLDLKNDHDKSIFIDMLKRASVLAENFHPGTMKKLGFSQEGLQEISSRLIYVSPSGFGHIGPLKDVFACGTIIQATSGVAMKIGYLDAPPVCAGASLADLCGDVYLFSGIVSAPYGREKSQRGTHVDIAVFDVTLSSLERGLTAYIATGKPPQRLGNRHPYMVPSDVLDTQNEPITICCDNNKLFSALCQALELTEPVNDPQFSSNILRVHNQATLKEYIERTLKAQVAEVWLARIHEVGVPIASLLSVAEAINSSQTQARDMLVETGGIMMPSNSTKISGCMDLHVMPGAATFDQHGEQIRQESSSQM